MDIKDTKDTNAKEQTHVTSIEQLEIELGSIRIKEMPRSMTLTAQELYMIRMAGYEPVQVVFGNIVYSMGLKGIFKTIGNALKRGELPDFTRMNQDARVIAMNRMLKEAKLLGATDVMDVTLSETTWSDFLEVSAQGTAVIKVMSEPLRVGIVVS